MVIDGHIHLVTPDEELDPFGRFLQSRGRLKGWSSVDDLVASMDKDGIDLGIIVYGSNKGREEARARFPDRIKSFFGVSLRAIKAAPEQTLSEVVNAIKGGYVGIGEVTPYREGFGLDDPVIELLAGLAINLDVPLHVEATATVGDYIPGRTTTPLYDIERFAMDHPKLKLILSDWGAGLCLFEMMPEVAQTLRNVYYDTASIVDEYEIDIMLSTVPKVVRAHKILYGSGSPYNERYLGKYKEAPAPKETVARILGSNYKTLLKL
jgi:predicted TIM-barrel fold metal-dependent hydrolase